MIRELHSYLFFLPGTTAKSPVSLRYHPRRIFSSRLRGARFHARLDPFTDPVRFIPSQDNRMQIRGSRLKEKQ
jgi:hypothetical protein